MPQGQAPVLTGPITCGGDNTISGILFDGEGTQADGIVVDTVGDVTISNNTFRNFTDNYIECDDVTGTTTITENQFDPGDSMSNYINVSNTDTDGDVTITNNEFDDDNANDPSTEAVEFDIEGTTTMNLTFTGNGINGDGTGNTFSDGIEVDCNGTSTVTFTIDSNTISGLEEDGVSVQTDSTASSSGSVSSNMIDDVGDDAISVETSGGTTTINNNVIDDTGGEGIDFDFDSQGGTFILTSNQISNAGDNGIDYSDSTSTTPALIALRNNTVTDSAGFSVLLDPSGAVEVCADVTGNVVNDDMSFDDTSSADLRVEDFVNILTINSFTGASVQEPNDPVVSVADGTCMIP